MLKFLLPCLSLHTLIILLLISIIHILVLYFLCCFYFSSCFISSLASFLIFPLPFFPGSFFICYLPISTFLSSSRTSSCLPFLIFFQFQYFVRSSISKILNLPSPFTFKRIYLVFSLSVYLCSHVFVSNNNETC